jgi:hypothetical protein
MDKLKKFLLHEYTLVFLFCLAVIHGAAFSLMDNYDQLSSPDCQTYTGLARFDLHQSPVRRYRPIVPLLAASVNAVAGRAFNVIRPMNFNGDFPLAVSFYLVNCLLMSLWGLVIYRFCRSFGLPVVYALAGLLVMLTCRWTPYIAGTPIADSIYCLVVGITLLGIKERNNTLLTLAIFIGPFAKEAFVFIAPLIFFFGSISKVRQILYFAAAAIMVFSFRYAFDMVAGLPPTDGLSSDVGHIYHLADHTRRLFSFHGAYDVLSNPGVWIIFPIIALLIGPGYKAIVRANWHLWMSFFMLAIFVHMVLSSSFERMFYLSMPLICLFCGFSMQVIHKHLTETKK